MKKVMWIQTAAVALAFLAVILLSGQLRQEAFDIGDLSSVDVAAAEAQFAQSQSNEDLVLLVKALCWQYCAGGNEAAAQPLRDYGQQLLDRAKAETIDLERADNPEHMLQVLRVVRALGAR